METLKDKLLAGNKVSVTASHTGKAFELAIVPMESGAKYLQAYINGRVVKGQQAWWNSQECDGWLAGVVIA